ncbi:hypothetical protein J4Q44_G00177670 [Coregonus suidteri]|uniref:RING-type domain-containing protein n=1 Tax=Coregonus suidteri TaxID=861788 RepID=A0AAN8LG38_9TELE
MEAKTLLAHKFSCCAVCSEIFTVPLDLSCPTCGCSFCIPCLDEFWEQKGSEVCPMCIIKRPPQKPPQRKCEEHWIKLSLFCVTDLQPICSECPLTGQHVDHRVYPIKEALEDCKVCLKE